MENLINFWNVREDMFEHAYNTSPDVKGHCHGQEETDTLY